MQFTVDTTAPVNDFQRFKNSHPGLGRRLARPAAAQPLRFDSPRLV